MGRTGIGIGVSPMFRRTAGNQPPFSGQLFAYYRGITRFKNQDQLIDSKGAETRQQHEGYCYNFDGANDTVPLESAIPFEIGHSFSILANFNSVIATSYFIGDSSNAYGVRYNGTDFLVFNGGSALRMVAWAKQNKVVEFKCTRLNAVDYEISIDGVSLGVSGTELSNTISVDEVGARNGIFPYVGKLGDIKRFNASGDLENWWWCQEFKDEEGNYGQRMLDSVGGNHGTIENATLATFHAIDNDFPSLLNRFGYSEGVTDNIELVTNGDFDTDTDWLKGDGWSISSGAANCDGSQGATTLIRQPGVVTIAQKYTLTYEVSNFIGGLIRAAAGGGSGGIFRSSNGIYTELLTASGDNSLYLIGDVDFIGSIESISVKLMPYGLIPIKIDAQGNATNQDIYGNTPTHSGQVKHNLAVTGNPVAVFDGVGSYAEGVGHPKHAGLSKTTHVISFKKDSITPSGVRRLFVRGSTQEGFSGGQIFVHSESSNGTDFNTPVITIPVTSFSNAPFLVVTRDFISGAVEVYLEGELIGSGIMSNAVGGTTLSSPFTLGANSSQTANGAYSLFASYDRILSSDEIRNYTPSILDGLIEMYSLSEGRNNVIYDRAANPVDLTIQNATLATFWDEDNQALAHFMRIGGDVWEDNGAAGNFAYIHNDINGQPIKTQGDTVTGFTWVKKVPPSGGVVSHNGAESGIKPYVTPEFLNTDSNNYWFDVSGNPLTKTFAQLNGNNNPTFNRNALTKEQLAVYDEALTGAELIKVIAFYGL